MAREDSYGRGRSEGADYGRESSGRGSGGGGPDYGREEWERNYGREGRLGREGGREGSSGPDFTREEWRGGERGERGRPYRDRLSAGDQYGGEYGEQIGEQYAGGYAGRPGGTYDYEGLAFGRGGREEARETFAGRGPKSYKRSDERITEDVNERLTRHPGIDATDIEVRVRNGEVTLSGTVDERRAKRLAEDIVEDISGVTDVKNEIRVSRGGAGRAAEREASVTTTREGRAGREGKSPQEGTEVRRATRSSTSGGTARS